MIANSLIEQFGQATNTLGVKWADWSHLKDSSVDQFETIVFAEDAAVGHAVKLFGVELAGS